MTFERLYDPLGQRPQTPKVNVRELIQRVRAGSVRVPAFQRPLRWTGRQNCELFDSLWRGYPIGSLLFWMRPASAGEITIGSETARVRIDHPIENAWWVVDGQQRMTALAACLLDIKQEQEKWRLYFDPTSKQFCEETMPVPPHWVPLSILGDLRRLGKFLRDWQGDEDLANVIEDAQQRLLDYEIPTYVVENTSEDSMRAIFARLNSTGARMRSEEVFHALLGGQASTAPRIDLDRLANAFGREGFGVPARSEVMKMVLAMAGLDPTDRPERIPHEKLQLLPDPGKAEDAIVHTVHFLMADAGIPHLRLLPYPVVAVILSRWFLLFPETNDWNRKRLVVWLWRGASTGAHRVADVTRSRRQLAAIKSEDENGSIGRMLSLVEGAVASEWRLDSFWSQSAKSRIETLAMLARSPTALVPSSLFGESENELSNTINLHALLDSEGRLAREIFLQRDCAKLSEEGRALAKTAANRILLDKAHQGLASHIKKASVSDDFLNSHLLSGEIYRALVDKNIEQFMRLRAQAIKDCVTEFLARRAHFGDTSFGLHPLKSYLRSEDSAYEEVDR